MRFYLGVCLILSMFMGTGLFAQTSMIGSTVSQTTHTIGDYVCDGGNFPVVYYVGSDGYYPGDIFGGNINLVWLFNNANTFVSVADSNNALSSLQFKWVSEGKPDGVNEVAAIASTGPMSIGTNVPNGHQRSDMIAQIVYHLKRFGYTNGPVPTPDMTYVVPGSSSQLQAVGPLAVTPSVNEEDNECRNIHIAFCGDGITDNGSISSSSNINAVLDGGEQCDDGNNINGDGCENNCTITPVNLCPAGTDNAGNLPEVPGTSCDDGDPDTENDVWDSTGCNCDGIPVVNVCPAGTDNAGNEAQTPSTSCDDGNPDTENDVWDSTGCNCSGTPIVNLCPIGTDNAGNLPEAPGSSCDDGNPDTENDVWDSTGCNCTGTPVGTSICGEKDGGTMYDFDNEGDGLDPIVDAARLCPIGYDVVNFSYNAVTHVWTWNCEGAGGVSPVCSASEQRCGDGIANGGEMCDDGNDNNTDACKNNCQPPLGNPVCGEKHNGVMYDFDNQGDGLDPVVDAAWLCPSDHSVENFQYDSLNHVWTWQCKKNNSLSPICIADEQRCGDGIINGGEACDGGVDCSDECTTETDGGSSCEELYVSKPSGEIPFTSTFTCSGIGTEYEIILTDENNNVVQVWNSNTATYTFTEVGEYHVQCLVDGQSGATCEAGSADGPLANNPFVGGNTLMSYEQYVQFSQTSSLVQDALKSIDWTKISSATSENSVVLSPLYQSITQTYAAVSYAVNSSCDDPCRATLIAHEPSGPACEITTNPAATIYSTRNQTIEVSCDIQGVAEDDIRIDCGNGQDIVLGTVAICDYVGYGTYSPRCFSSTEQCATSLTLRGGGTGGDNYCGDGEIHPELGEECDDGNGIDGDGCSSNCDITGGGGGGGGGGTGGDNYCGDGVTRHGEACDDGSANGLATSICSKNCEIIKGFDPAKCEFIDPPSIQLGEILPYRRGIESNEWIEDGVSCEAGNYTYDRSWDAAKDIGKIEKESMVCHFEITAPDGDIFSHTKPCFVDEFNSQEVEWYRDFLQDNKLELDDGRGTSYLETRKMISSDVSENVYGEYMIALVGVDYDMCVGKGLEKEGFDVEGNPYRYIDTTIDGMASFSYDGRVCQYNFAVTAPYMVQKGISLSSDIDDIQTLKKFLDITGVSILQGTRLNPIDSFSTIDVQEDLKKEFSTYALRASERVTDVNNDFARGGRSFMKVPGEEIYYTNEDVVLRMKDVSKPFNGGLPTALLVDDGAQVVIEGSLYGNILVINPDGDIVFQSVDCDKQDIVQGIFLANNFVTEHEVYGDVYYNLANTDVRKPVWCDGGGLVVEGILLGGSETSVKKLTQARRSTLANRFDASEGRDKQIFDGAALRIQGAIGTRDNLPPITKNLIDILQISK